MRRWLRLLLLSLPVVPAHAEGSLELCQSVAHHLWAEVAAAPLAAQTPLAQLTAAAPAFIKAGVPATADVQADAPLAEKLAATPPRDMVRLGETEVWLLDRVDGTLGCHVAVAAVIPANAPAHEIPLPGNPDPSDLCALSALTGVTIDGAPALWIEQSGAFSNRFGQSTVVIAALNDKSFAPPCEVTIDYALADRVTHALCPELDCIPLIQAAGVLAMRLRQGENAETLSAGVIRGDKQADGGDYPRMAEIASGEKQAVDLPSFGVTLDTPYTTFADFVTFPLRLNDGYVYLARMGHGSFGWRQTADTLLALYRLRGDRLTPAASVMITAARSGVMDVAAR